LIGPQGYVLPVAGTQGYLNFKAYGDSTPLPPLWLERMADVVDLAGSADKPQLTPLPNSAPIMGGSRQWRNDRYLRAP
jgi:hypothetical protein